MPTGKYAWHPAPQPKRTPTGRVVDPVYSSVAQKAWIKANRPDLAPAFDRGTAAAGRPVLPLRTGPRRRRRRFGG